MITFAEPIQVGPNAFLITWTSDVSDASYRIFRYGKLISETTVAAIRISAPVGESILIEVLDDDSDQTQAANPRARIRFLAGEAVDHYRVEQFIGGEWVLTDKISELDAAGYEVLTAALPDAEGNQIRITPVGTNENVGTPAVEVVDMARHPDPPDVTAIYASGTGLVTIAAA